MKPKDKCPHCKVSLVGKPIPKKMRRDYAPPYYWRREIALYDRDLDRTVGFQCPDCGETWKREL